MDKLTKTALATGLFLAGTFGAYEADNSLTHETSTEKLACYSDAPEQAKTCVSEIDKNNESQELVIEALELGLLLGAAANALELTRTLRKS